MNGTVCNKKIFMMTVSFYAVSALVGNFAYAGELPDGGKVIDGSASIYKQGSTLNIDQSTDKAIIDWNSFSVGKDNTVNFNQPSRESATLNRVTGSFTSEIAGRINANGSVFLVNPNGILITADGVIDTGNFVASTLDIDNNDFLNSNYTFTKSDQNGVVSNRGTVSVDDGGFVALLGGAVKNDGFVRAHVGTIGFAGGEKIVMSFGNNDFLRVEVPTDTWEQLTDADGNKVSATLDLGGKIESRGGFIDITVADATDILRQTISIDGVISANTVSSQDGIISISGGSLGLTGNGRITADADYGDAGRIDVAVRSLNMSTPISATAATGNGGTIEISLQQGASLSRGAVFDVSGKQGGRVSFIGGLSGDAYYKVVGTGDFIADGSDGTGGYVDISNKNGLVGLFSGTLSAKGAVEGGRIRIGGAFQGGTYDSQTSSVDKHTQHLFVHRWSDNTDLVSAGKTSLGTGVRIDVSSASGTGGTVVLWADHTTNNYAQITATGGTKGGAVEISGKKKVDSFGLKRVNIGNGVLLLDPKNVVINKFSNGFSQAKRIMSTTPLAGFKLDLDDNDNFGSSVAISEDGTRLAVGARFDDTGATNNGAVYLFTVGGTDSHWGSSLLQEYKIAYGSGLDVKGSGAQFGKSVAFNDDGTKLVVGMPYVGKASSYRSGSGRIFLFSVDWGKSVTNSSYLEYGGNGYFGTGVALSDDGTKLAVGETHDSTGKKGDANYVYEAGSVSLFVLSGDGENWGTSPNRTRTGRIVNGNGGLTLSAYDAFGYAVALSGDGSRLVVGAEGTDRRKGAIHLFTVDGATWGQSFTRTAGISYGPFASLNEGDFFGGSVALNDAGTRLAVGAIYDDTAGKDLGAVYLFTVDGTTWGDRITRVRIITDGVGVSLSSIDKFGYSVALNTDGSQLVVGAVDNNTGGSIATHKKDCIVCASGSKRGAVYLLALSGYTWGAKIDVQRIITDQKVLDLNPKTAFGASVALSDDGTKLAVGAPRYNNKGAVYLFEINPVTDAWGTEVLYTRRIADGEGVSLANTDLFGSSIALNGDGNKLAVGAENTDSNIGKVHLFTVDGSRWGNTVTETKRITTGTGGLSLQAGDHFGGAVALSNDGTKLAVGAHGTDDNTGAVYLFTVGGSYASWGKTVDKTNAIKTGISGLLLPKYTYFGLSVAFDADGERLAIGAIGHSGGAVRTGAVYLFTVGTGSQWGDSVTYTAKIADGLGVSLSERDSFGTSVALNNDGDMLAVGAVGNDTGGSGRGAVYLFAVGGNIWGYQVTEKLKIAHDSGVSISDNSRFGTDVAFNGSGSQLVVSAHEANAKKGVVHLFTLDGFNHIWNSRFGQIQKPFFNDEHFGRSVALSGDGTKLAVGAYEKDTALSKRKGVVYLFALGTSSVWGDTVTYANRISDGNGVKLSSTSRPNHDGSAYATWWDSFGESVALSSDGTKLAVGAIGADSYRGSVYLLTIGGNTWGDMITEKRQIDMRITKLSLSSGDYFGKSVALSNDGTKLAIGATGDDAANDEAGAVYLFTINGNNWGSSISYTNKVATGFSLKTWSHFGQSIALSENGAKMAVGAFSDDADKGAVYLFTVGRSAPWGNAVTYTTKIAHGAGVSLSTNDYFGYSVSLSDDGSKLAVGAYGHKTGVSGMGAVYLFTVEGYIWGRTVTQNGRITHNAGVSLSANDNFGRAAILNSDGSQLIVGGIDRDASDADSGAIYLFTVGGSKWGETVTQTNQVVEREVLNIQQTNRVFSKQNISLTANEGFGSSVALSDDETKMAVGARFNDTGGTNRGAVYLFELVGGDYFGDDIYYTAKVADGNGVSLSNIDRFGTSVALTNDGNTLVVGAPYDDTGGSNFGAVYMFRIGGGIWGTEVTQLQKHHAVTDGHFGTAVAISGDGTKLVVGSPYSDIKHSTKKGVVQLYDIDNANNFTLIKTYGQGDTVGSSTNLSLQNGEQFGQAVALSNNGAKLAVGALGRDGYKGRVYLFTIDTTDTGWGQSLSLQNTIDTRTTGVSLSNYDYFGASVALSNDGTKLAVGAWGEDGTNTWNIGSVYLFDVGGTTWGNTVEKTHEITDGTGVSLEASNIRFGFAVALTGDGNKLVVGADRQNGKVTNEGAIYLLDLTDNSAPAITEQLEAGTDVKIVASNDITINADITPTIGTGKLTLSAGRSIIINGDVKIKGGLVITANDATDTQFIASDRDSGKAQITVASEKTISGGNGDLLVKMLTGRNGGNATKNQTGKITVWRADGKRVSIVHLGKTQTVLFPTSNSEIIVLSGGQIKATGNLNKGEVAIELAADIFTSNAGSTSLYIDDSTGDQGRYLVWTKTPKDNQLGDSSNSYITNYGFVQFNKPYHAYRGDFQSNTRLTVGTLKDTSGFIYRAHPALRLTATPPRKTKTYDSTAAAPVGNPSFAFANQTVDGLNFTVGGVSGNTRKALDFNATVHNSTGTFYSTSGTVQQEHVGTNLILKYTAHVTYKDGNNKPVYGFSTAVANVYGASITRRHLLLRQDQLHVKGASSADGKQIYDGTQHAQVVKKIGEHGFKTDSTTFAMITDDDVSLNIAIDAFRYANADAGKNKNVLFDDAQKITLSGTDADNYMLYFMNVGSSIPLQPLHGMHGGEDTGIDGEITARVLKLDGSELTAINRVYDGTTAVTVYEKPGQDGFAVADDTTGIVNNDSISLNIQAGAFEYADSSASTHAKQIQIGTPTKLMLSGVNSGNYLLKVIDTSGAVVETANGVKVKGLTGYISSATRNSRSGMRQRSKDHASPTGRYRSSGNTKVKSTAGNSGNSIASIVLLGAGATVLMGGAAATGATGEGLDVSVGGIDTLFNNGVYAHLNGVDMRAIYQPPTQNPKTSVFDTARPSKATYKAKYTTTYDLALLAHNIKTQKATSLYELDEKVYDTIKHIFVQQTAPTDKTAGIGTEDNAPA